MSLHDAYARITPIELAFPEPDAVANLLDEVREEAGGRGQNPSNPQAFVTMGAVGAFIRRLQGPDAPPESVHEYGALVYHALHMHAADTPVFVLGASTARYLVEGAPDGEPRPPAEAGYLQFPQHLFWAPSPGGDAPDSVDGLFWTISDLGMLHSLLITGIRPDRPGFGTIPVPEAPIAEAPDWVDAHIRAGGGDFASALPGAQLDGLYAFESAGEVLKLIARFFAYVAAVPGAVVSGGVDGPPRGEAEGPGAPPRSSLPFKRVVLDA